nr:MAG TPA: hypothetical protein [Microviridae sp.]
MVQKGVFIPPFFCYEAIDKDGLRSCITRYIRSN